MQKDLQNCCIFFIFSFFFFFGGVGGGVGLFDGGLTL